MLAFERHLGTTNKTVSALPPRSSGVQHAPLSISYCEAAQRTRGATRTRVLKRRGRGDKGAGVVRWPQCGSVGGTPLGRNNQGILKLRCSAVPHRTVVTPQR